MTGADVIVVQHVSQAAIDEYGPGCGSLAAKAENGALALAAHGFHVLMGDAAFGRYATRANAHAQGVQHTLLHQLDQWRGQRPVPEPGGMARHLARGIQAGNT